MGTGRTEKAIKNISYSILNQVISILLAFVLRTIFLKYFGVAYLGLNGIFSDVLGVLSMADLGFGTAMVYSFYKPLAENDVKQMAALTTFYRRVYRIIAIVVAVVGIGLTPFISLLINMEEKIPYIEVYYLIALSHVIVSYLCVSRTSILSADQKSYKSSQVTIGINVTKNILQIIVIIWMRSYIVYLLLGTFFYFANNVLISHKATKEYPFIAEKEDMPKEEKKEIFRNVMAAFVYKVSNVLLNATDNVIISVLIGTIAVGYYSNYLMVQTKLVMFYTIIFSALTASIGNLIVREKSGKRYRVFQCEQSICYIMCCVIVPCFVLLINDFICLWLGEEYLLSWYTVVAIGINLYLSCVLQPVSTFREATGLYKKTKWVTFAGAMINIILSVFWGKEWGLSGILFASAISRLVTSVWYEPVMLFRDFFDKTPVKYYVELAANAIVILGFVTIGYLTNQYAVHVTIDSWWKWAGKAGGIGLGAVLISAVIYRKSAGIQFLKNKRNFKKGTL